MIVTAFVRAKAGGVEPPGELVLVRPRRRGARRRLRREVPRRGAPGAVRGAGYALGEFGGFTLARGRERFYPIQVAEKQICWLKATDSRPRRARRDDRPRRRGARLASCSPTSTASGLPVHVTPVVREMVETIAADVAAARRPCPALAAEATPDRPGPAAARRGGRAVRADAAQHRQRDDRARRREDQRRAERDRARAGRPRAAGFAPEQLIARAAATSSETTSRSSSSATIRAPAEPDLGLFDTLAGVIRELDPGGIPMPLLQIGVTDGRFFSPPACRRTASCRCACHEDFHVHEADPRSRRADPGRRASSSEPRLSGARVAEVPLKLLSSAGRSSSGGRSPRRGSSAATS